MRLALVFVLSVLPALSQAQERIALVFGISKYETIPTLDNTVNDARLITQTLESIGFEVMAQLDSTTAEMRAAIDAFAFRAETADLALVYFAGHGVEVQGENFLIPADAQVASNKDVQRVSVSLSELLHAVDRARKMRIVVLDSCRNNPFGDALMAAEDSAATGVAGDGLTRGGGLAAPSPDRGTLVAFAARDGQVALDGIGENSPFAIALADRMSQPGLEISLMFRQVRDQVLRRTANLQEPFTYGSLSGIPFYLAGDTGDAPISGEIDRRVAWARIQPDQERQLAALAETGDTRSMLGLAYIRLNPDEKRFDPAEAVGLLQRAAAAGSPEAQFELGKLYETGVGVAQDQAAALDLLQRAADQNFPDALNDLGFMHYQGGLGLVRNPAMALSYFERAADQRHPEALFNFAALIDDGLIPNKGPEDAAGYLYLALRSGSEDVLDLLSERPEMFKPATRQALQAKLREFDLYAGAIDGNFGPGTQRGLRRAYGLPE